MLPGEETVIFGVRKAALCHFRTLPAVVTMMSVLSGDECQVALWNAGEGCNGWAGGGSRPDSACAVGLCWREGRVRKRTVAYKGITKCRLRLAVGRDALHLEAQVGGPPLRQESRQTSSSTRCLSLAQLKALRVSVVLRTNLLQLKYLLKTIKSWNLVSELLEQSKS